MKSPLEVVIVSGLSGSGKSTAIHVLEDLGYYCIDNLPVILIQRFLELCKQSQETIGRVALGVDVRERQFFTQHAHVLDEIRAAGFSVHVLFLEAADEVLVRRFSETRRPHPLAGSGGPVDGIRREREEVAWLRERADRIIDTSALTVHQLRDELSRQYRNPHASDELTVILLSFGFKFGIPTEADMVFDARFLANPFFVDDLRPLTGLEPAVAEYVFAREESAEYLRRIDELLRFTIPHFRRDGKKYLTVGIGCTGGRHRSVAVVERLAAGLAGSGQRVELRHRDLKR